MVSICGLGLFLPMAVSLAAGCVSIVLRMVFCSIHSAAGVEVWPFKDGGLALVLWLLTARFSVIVCNVFLTRSANYFVFTDWLEIKL